MTEEVEVETRQIYLIPTEGPDGMQNTEVSLRIAVMRGFVNFLLIQVIITDLGEIGENTIIVFEENVGVGAEEIVANQEYVTYTGDNEEVLEVKLTFQQS